MDNDKFDRVLDRVVAAFKEFCNERVDLHEEYVLRRDAILKEEGMTLEEFHDWWAHEEPKDCEIVDPVEVG